jgi:hypothetical protein
MQNRGRLAEAEMRVVAEHAQFLAQFLPPDDGVE